MHPRDNPFVSIHVSKLIESMYPFNATLPFIPLPRRIKPRCKTFQNHVFANHSLSFLRTFLLASTKISLFRNKLLSRWVEHLFDITVAHDSTRKLGRSIDRSIPRRQRHPLGPFYSCQVAVRLHGNKLGFNFSWHASVSAGRPCGREGISVEAEGTLFIRSCSRLCAINGWSVDKPHRYSFSEITRDPLALKDYARNVFIAERCVTTAFHSRSIFPRIRRRKKRTKTMKERLLLSDSRIENRTWSNIWKTGPTTGERKEEK